MHISLQDIASFIVVSVILKTVILSVMGDVLRRAFKKWLIRTEHDALLWFHYRNRAARVNHHPKHPRDCPDGDCPKLTK